MTFYICGSFMPKPKNRNSKPQKKSGRATVIKALLLLAIIPLSAAAVFLIRYYYIFDGTIEAKLGKRYRLAETKIYAAPTLLYPGKALSSPELVSQLHRLGYPEDNPDADNSFYKLGKPNHVMVYNGA